jgi:hypothetical protein
MLERLIFVFGSVLLCCSSAEAQSIQDLRQQVAQTRQMIDEAESSGVDASMIDSLRENLEIAEEAIREMESDQSSSQSDAGEKSSVAETAVPVNPTVVYPTRPSLAAKGACSGFSDNYRKEVVAPGVDAQLGAMCGQALEYYSMYQRAIAQGYSEADANRTYEAHEKAMLVANSFYADAGQTARNQVATDISAPAPASRATPQPRSAPVAPKAENKGRARPI